MFAVIILGIGFIMVAAIFPVAIQQTKLTVDETTAASVARQAVSTLEQIVAGSDNTMVSGAPTQLFPYTNSTGDPTPASVFAMRDWVDSVRKQPNNKSLNDVDLLWRRLRGSLIVTDDPRFAWTALYSREINSPYIRVYIFVLQQRYTTNFATGDILPSLPVLASNLQPRLVQITVNGAPAGSPDPDTISIDPADAAYAAEGAYLVTASNNAATPPGEVRTGLILKLGSARDTINGIYELDPAYDIPAGTTWNAEAWIVGRALVPTPGNPNQLVPQGPAMDVAVYTTFLRVN
jgi:hypothetical protein